MPSIALERIMPPRLGSVDPSTFPDEEFDLYSIPAFDQGEPEVLEGKAIGSAKQIVQPGDVLLSRIVPHIRRAWVVGNARGRRIIASGEWIVFRGEGVDQRYLRHVLVSDPFHAEFMRTVSGVGGSLLRARPAYVAKIKIPLPLLPEQRRIAEILDKADALRVKRRAVLAQLDTLTQSIFLDMFGDPATNSKGWAVSSLSALLRDVTNGMTRRRAESDVGQSIVLRLRDIREGWIDFSEVNRITLTLEEAQKYEVLEGDLLFIRVNGNPDYVGRCALFVDHPERIYFNDHVMRVRIDSSRVNGVFLTFLLNSAHGKREIARHRKTSAGQHTINQDGLSRIRLPLPPIELQQCFASLVAAVDARKRTNEASLLVSDQLFASLQHSAFRGEM